MLEMLWMYLIVALIIAGLYFCIKFRFKNLKLISFIKNISKEYSIFFYLTLGSKIGVGSIIGVVIAIHFGGMGTILWIWIFALISSSLVYAESMLGTRYKEKRNNIHAGGPHFYIKKGLGKKKLAIVYLVVLIMSYTFFFLMIQTNTLNDLMIINFNVDEVLLFFITTIILFIMFFLSTKGLLQVINKLVPIMCVYLVVICFVVILRNLDLAFPFVKDIFAEAFNFKSITAGLIPSIIIGIKRNIFGQELMLGTTAIFASVKEGDRKIIAGIQVLANLFISLVFTTLIGFVVYTFIVNNPIETSNYNVLVSQVFNYNFGSLGRYHLILLIFMFCSTTLISGFYFGLSNLLFITKNKFLIFIYRISVLLFTVSGLVLTSKSVWWLVDFMMLILIIINLISVVKLRSKV